MNRPVAAGTVDTVTMTPSDQASMPSCARTSPVAAILAPTTYLSTRTANLAIDAGGLALIAELEGSAQAALVAQRSTSVLVGRYTVGRLTGK